LIELASRLLRSVWERKSNDIFLIGPQHFDLGIPEVRDKFTEISGRRDVIAKDFGTASNQRTPRPLISVPGRRQRRKSERFFSPPGCPLRSTP
jgi:hypothetical protein